MEYNEIYFIFFLYFSIQCCCWLLTAKHCFCWDFFCVFVYVLNVEFSICLGNIKFFRFFFFLTKYIFFLIYLTMLYKLYLCKQIIFKKFFLSLSNLKIFFNSYFSSIFLFYLQVCYEKTNLQKRLGKLYY